MITQEQRATLERTAAVVRRDNGALTNAIRNALATINELTRERNELAAKLAAYEEPQCTCDITCAGYHNSDQCACGCKAACHR